MVDLVLLIRQLLKEPIETSWLEFKGNITDSEKIGRTICALSNGAALSDRDTAYMVWGIDDTTHEVIGTRFDWDKEKVGNENLRNWLRSALSPTLKIDPYTTSVDGQRIFMLFISRAENNPTLFRRLAYIRDGNYVKQLNELPSLEQRLWSKLQSTSFEDRDAAIDVPDYDIGRYLDFQSVFRMLKLALPTDHSKIIGILSENGFIVRQDDGNYRIPVHSAILFANRMEDFPILAGKAIRLIKYIGNSKTRMEKELECPRGYACSFEEVMHYVALLMPSEEIIDGATRYTHYAYPLLAVREVLSNALIHQDLSVNSSTLTVEFFDDRIVITNPGRLLVDKDRVVNATPFARNVRIARSMRRLGLCEELGTGWDKIVESCEDSLISAPEIVSNDYSTSVTMVHHRPFADMTSDEKIWSCYMHACIQYARNQRLTNGSLRVRFGLDASNASGVAISKLIRSARDRGLIQPYDVNTSSKKTSYIPYWC